jgi:hypothetical protein
LSVIMCFGGRSCFFTSRIRSQLGCFGVAARLNDLIEKLTVLISRPPQPAFPAMIAHRDFVEVPDICFSRCLAAPTTHILGTVLAAPSTDRLIRNDNAPFEQHFYDIAQAQIET